MPTEQEIDDHFSRLADDHARVIEALRSGQPLPADIDHETVLLHVELWRGQPVVSGDFWAGVLFAMPISFAFWFGSYLLWEFV